MSESPLADHTKSWLSAVSADLHRAIDTELDGLRGLVEQRIAALQTALAASDTQLGQVVHNIDALNRELLQKAAASARQEEQARAAAELASVRAELTTRLESSRSESEAVRKALENQLVSAERDIAAVRQKRDEHSASLEEAHRRIAGLEESNGQAILLRELAEARLTEELQRRVAIEKQLESSREDLLLARAEAESRRLEAQVHNTRTRPAHEPVSASSLHHTITALKEGIHKLSSVRHDELVSSLLEQLGCHFFGVAIFAVTAQGVRLWKSRTIDPSLPPPPADAQTDGDSALARSLRERSPVRVQADRSEERLGLWKRPIRHAIALPISAHGHPIAVVYAENTWEQVGRDPETVNLVAEILVGCVNRHLTGSSTNVTEFSLAQNLQPPAAADLKESAAIADADPHEFPVSRQASRVKVDRPAVVLIDGISSTLVDISTLGAQVLCPTTLRPNRSIRLVLQNEDGRVTCDARIVWARLESPTPVMGTQFRAGVQFVDIHRTVIEGFVARHRQSGPMSARVTS